MKHIQLALRGRLVKAEQDQVIGIQQAIQEALSNCGRLDIWAAGTHVRHDAINKHTKQRGAQWVTL
jgi:hypothetical protein